MTDIATWIHDRLAADHDLNRSELVEMAVAIGEEESLWRPFERHDSSDRFYQQLYRDPNVDVWLICWLSGQGTGYHDHDRSDGAVYVCRGSLHEDYFCRDADGWIRERTNLHEVGSHFCFEAADIHGVRHAAEGPATSVHVYSPALWRMGHYEPDARGALRRISVTYADELLGVA